MKKGGKLLALLLCLALLTSLFPSALAAETPDAAPTETEDAVRLPEEEAAGEQPPEESGAEPLPPEEEQAEEAPFEESAGDGVPEEPETADPPVPVRVAFLCSPAETVVTVYDPAHPDENGEPGAVAPEEDGSYLLLPGLYLYEASCEGCEPLEKTELTVTGAVEILLALCPADRDEPEEPGLSEDEESDYEDVPEEEAEEGLQLARSTASWSLPTLDGGTVTQNSFADKLRLLVFFNADEDCYYSNRTIQELAEADWIKNDAIQVIAIEGLSHSAEETAAFLAANAPDCDDIVFAYDGGDLMWQYVRETFGSNSISFCFCVLLQNGAVVRAWDSNGSAGTAAQQLSDFIDIGQEWLPDTTAAWSLPTLDGGNVTKDSFADKLQLLVFYDGTGNCYNSIRTLQELADAYWIGNEALQVIAVESRECSAGETAAFLADNVPDCDEIVFAYDGWDLMLEYILEVYQEYYIYYSFCVILKDGAIVDFWNGNDSARTAAKHLSDFVELGQDERIGTTVKNGSFRQSEARRMLDMINAFRTGDQAWFWNPDNSTKTTYAPGELGALSYDYDLERVAMQRAAELAVLYSHTRPDGSSCHDLEINGVTSWGENIAWGQTSVGQVFSAWREDNYKYGGQGHRRNMLYEQFTAVGFGCFLCDGKYYWVQEFGYENSGAPATAPNDSQTQVRIEYLKEQFPYLPPAPVDPPAPVGDLNLDGCVNGADLVRFAQRLKVGKILPGGDLNSDGKQNALDLALLSRIVKGRGALS